MPALVYTSDSGKDNDELEVSSVTSGSRFARLTSLSTDDIDNDSTVDAGAGSLTDALNTLDARKAGYLDALDFPIGLWNFNGTLASAMGGPAFSVTAGVAVGFTEVIPGGLVGVTAAPGVRLALPVTPAFNLLGAMEAELIVMLEDVDAGMIIVSHGGTGGTSASNKAYEFTIPSATYPRNMGFNSENGAGVAQNFATPTAALSRSVPPVHVIMSMGWSRTLAGVRTPLMNGAAFSAASGVLALPTDGSASFLTLFSDALVANISFAVIASLALYDRVRTPTERANSYNRSLGKFWGKIPVP